MNKTGKILLALAVVVVVAVGAVLFANMYKQPAANDSSGNDTNTESQNSSETSQPATEPAVTITYDGTSFSLSSNSVKAGETVKVVNNSSKELDFDSDPHPVHTDNSELNAGPIDAGKSKSFVLNTKGTWGFHNHLDSSQRGSLTVE